jgi:hypothetical protein
MHLFRLKISFVVTVLFVSAVAHISCQRKTTSKTIQKEETNIIAPRPLTLQEQKNQLLINHIADNYTPPSLNIGDPEKYYVPKLMARFEKYGIKDSASNEWLTLFSKNAPFHFTLVGISRVLYLYPDAPAIQKNEKSFLKEGFQRNDSYNPWTAEGTENHINMSRTSGYLYAQLAVKKYPNEFPEAPKRLQEMKEWILYWSKRVYEVGTGEWNSSTYEFYNLAGWLNLYDFAKDPEVKMAAKAVLDYYASEMALHYSYGAVGGSEMRSSGIAKNNQSASYFLSWYWFADKNMLTNKDLSGTGYIQLTHAITSTYKPVQAMIDLALKKHIKTPEIYKNSKPSYMLDKPAQLHQFFYVHPEYTIGSAITPFGGWTGATIQMVNWRLVAKAENMPFGYEIGGNGSFHANRFALGRSPFDQLIQHNNVVVQMTKIPKNVDKLIDEARKNANEWQEKWLRDFKVRFPTEQHKINQKVVSFTEKHETQNSSYITLPAESVIVQKDNVTFASVENVYIALVALSNEKSEIQEVSDTFKRKIVLDKNEQGKLCGFVIEVSSRNEFNTFEAFKTTFLAKKRLELINKTNEIKYENLKGEVITATFTDEGEFVEPIIDWGYGTTQQHIRMSSPPFIEPTWKKEPGSGRVPQWSINGKKVILDSSWAVYEGESFYVKNGKLAVKDANGKWYTVDYTQKLPTFSE